MTLTRADPFRSMNWHKLDSSLAAGDRRAGDARRCRLRR
jgi:hypothetical protein